MSILNNYVKLMFFHKFFNNCLIDIRHNSLFPVTMLAGKFNINENALDLNGPQSKT